MEENLGKPGIPRPSFVTAVEMSPRAGPVDANDIKRNLYGDFSSASDISQRDSLESRERVHVCLRVRPLMQSEKESDSQDCISVLDSTSIVLKAPKSSMVFRLSEKNLGQVVQKFTFSQVFGPETTQEEFFEGTVKQPVQDFLKGHSRLVFTYGVTNAGKTYTYQGTDENIGVLPRALDMLFKSIQGQLYPEMNLKPHRCREHKKLSKEEVREEMAVKNSLLRLMKEVDYQNGINGNCSRNASNSEVLAETFKEAEQWNMENAKGAQYSVWVSFCEIYNECIYDLLLPISNDKRRKLLRLAQDVKGCSYVKDLQWIQVSNSKEALRLMKLGLRHQSSASTKLNANSSRSHSIFTVKMLKIDSGATRVLQVSELFLCDLAGSERCTRTHNEGERLKESGNINTSLHILGKCIHALKTSQQSKLQQHIPFRESKLTHFFQGFFSGKGKVCMIVNVSQNASAYDETLNVLKFSAIAQKVMVLDSSSSPQEELLDQISVKSDSEISTEEGVSLPVKRATLCWESTLEDVMEDEEELLADSSEVHEETRMAKTTLGKEEEPEVIEEAISEEDEDSDIVMGKEYYQRLLNIIEDLKNKLIDERKDKLLLELRIREEVVQECSQHLAKKESNLREYFDRKEEMMEDNCEARMQLYKELVQDCIQLTNGKDGEETWSNEQDETLGSEARESGNAADLVCIVESLQQNVADIKQKAETIFELLGGLEDPQTTIEWLKKQLTEITAELSKTQEELLCRSKEMKIQENKLSESAKVLQDATEKMALQNKCIQELTQVVEQKDDEIHRLQDLISYLESVIKDSEATIATIKQEMERENKKTSCTQSKESMEQNGRKRCLEIEEQEGGPPAKQGPTNNGKDNIEIKKVEEMQPHVFKEIVVLEEENRKLETNLATLGGHLEKEKIESEGLSGEISLPSEEKTSDLSRELQQQQAYCGKIMSELATLKDTNKGQEEKIQVLLKERESANQTNAEEKFKVKAVEMKIGELHRLALQRPNVDVDLACGKEVLGLPKEMLEFPNERLDQTPVNVGQKNSFHGSIENIWEVSKQIIHASVQKSNLIEDLRHQAEQLQRRMLAAEEEMHQLKLKLSETMNQVDTSLQEKEGLLCQLRNLQQENTLYSEKCKDAENKALGYVGQMDGLLEECRLKESKIACLEQTLEDKESAILVLEKKLKDMQGKLNISESETKKLYDQELQLKEQVLELKSNLETIRLQDVGREETKQTLEQLNKDLLDSKALASRLQIELHRKDEEYADLKEKLADTKKQIEQVQRQVCTMRTEEKMLRNKVNDLEKAKNQLTEELDIKQRTIEQFNKEELNKKLEDVSKQFQRACKDLCSKEKIIEDMKLTLEEQEKTQAEQDQLLEAKFEETERFAAELEEWKKRCYELEKQKSDFGPPSINVEFRSEELPSDELKRLQEKLEECEEQHKMDRKKFQAEKMSLISQVKEAEIHRNREMKRFAEDREHHARQLAEAEKLVAQKDIDLQKWRAERDQLVVALEIQLSSLVSSNRQKDKEIEELKKSALDNCDKAHENTVEMCRISSPERSDVIKELRRISCEDSKLLKSKQMDPGNGNDVRDTDSLLPRPSRTSSAADIQIQEQSETILDSCEVSSESDQTSRFPKPEMEIHFTPLQPNKMEVKHQGDPSVVTIKVPKAKKRKSSAMEEEDSSLKTENEKNAASLADTNTWPDSLSRQKKKIASDPSIKKEYSLRKKHCVSSIKSPGHAGGTLQKFGYFLQSSPTIIQSKAKKLMTTIKSPKSAEEESIKENDLKPKRSKRRLYTTDISSPMEFSGHVIVMDQRESDHEIIRRRLRAKKNH
ncbi:kinesin-like protein KIF20B [Tiliqua scincoides]|uniref:kinesin-like protein KIF20B n=1 Tax=Tiliqua scincoides TaxID=71010 RepID=UPI003462BF75